MATIALYANKINQMPVMINDVKQAVSDYKSELSALKTRTLAINKSVCNLDDVISSIQTSTQTQEQKITSLDTFNQNSENFISDVVRIDSNVADVVKQRKDDFYDKYNYLKPECEKIWGEKAKEWFNSVVEWCKEHWVMIVTAIVVILVVAVAAICGVAIAFIAAVAGLVALVLCIADVICMLVTGGMGIADVLRENGFYVLADIFQGVSIGADIVSIAFPVGALIKTIAKTGVKTFAVGALHTAKAAFRETIEKVFKSGFKDGVKNFFKITFKNLILDVDDLKNCRAVPLDIPNANKHWTIDGDQLVPNSNTIPGRYNPDGLSMEGIMNKYGYDSVPLMKNGNPGLSVFSVADVDISMKNLDLDMDVGELLAGDISSDKFSRQLRKTNLGNADKQLKLNFENSMTDYATKAEYEKALGFKLTWHEDLTMKKCWLVPTEIHANIDHLGGVGNYKFIFFEIPDISNLIGKKITQWRFRFGSDR